MLDHGTGIVIGETAVVGDNCSLLQGVTLGGTGKETGDRHPKIGDNVHDRRRRQGARQHHASATARRVASGSVVLKDVPPETTVAGVPAKVVGPAGCPEPARDHGPAAAARRLRLRRHVGETLIVNPQEMVRVQAYLRKVFGAKTLSVRARPKIKDSAEVYVGEDFIGTLTVDNEDGELCYQFQMAILELDLEDV